jgi:release factor glutamine methyltransferase
VALAELRRRDAGPHPLAVDLGTGSGAIALSLAAEHPAVTVWGTDTSGGALDVARANLAGLGGSAAARVRLVAGDWWDALPVELRGTVDLAVANPPYISVPEMADLDAVVADWEPHAALQSGPEGLDDIRRILDGARHWLAPGGALVIEMAPHQAEPVVDLARRAGLVDTEVHRDLAGRDRMLLARRPRP